MGINETENRKAEKNQQNHNWFSEKINKIETIN